MGLLIGLNINIGENLYTLANYLGFSSPINVLDILRAVLDIGIVSYVIYRVIILVRETRAMQLIKGILFIMVAARLSDLLHLRTLAYLLNNTISYVAFAVVVLFQPELRRVLEQIGRNKFSNFFNFEEESSTIKTTAVIEEIIKAVTEMSKTKTGALIVIEMKTKIGEIINTGTEIDSHVSSELLINIFTPNTPLHDGAIIIRSNKLKAAACFLPLTDNPNLSRELGTRHRAAIGISEVSDAIAIVVSEETGKISFALNAGLTRNLTPDMLRKAMNKNLLESKIIAKKLSLWKVKSK